MAARDLAALGYNVREYKGGKQDWSEGKLPFEGEHPDVPFPPKK